MNWSGGLGGNKIYVQVSCQRIVSAAVKGDSGFGSGNAFRFKTKQKEFVNSPPTFEEMSQALCQMSVTQI